jgi:hypothetical protein
MTVLKPLEALVQEGVRRIEHAQELEQSIHEALVHGCGVAEGYFWAGATSRVEYDAACAQLRRVANERLALLDLKQQAIAEGMA